MRKVKEPAPRNADPMGREEGWALGKEGAEEDRKAGRQETVWSRNREVDNQEAYQDYHG